MAGRDTSRTLVIGDVRTVGPMIRQLRRAQGAGMEVVGACVSGIVAGTDRSSLVEGVPVFGYPEEAMEAISLLEAEVVAVSSDPELSGSGLRRLAWSLEERKVDLVIAPGLFEVAGPRLSIRPTAGMPLLHVERPAMSGARRVCKRVVDVFHVLFRRKIDENLLGLATGESLAHLNCLLARGQAVRERDAHGVDWYRAAA